MDRLPARDARALTLLVVIDAAADGAERIYREALADGATAAVHGVAPWARDGDAVDVGTASFLALYADEVIGAGLPASLSPKVQ